MDNKPFLLHFPSIDESCRTICDDKRVNEILFHLSHDEIKISKSGTLEDQRQQFMRQWFTLTDESINDLLTTCSSSFIQELYSFCLECRCLFIIFDVIYRWLNPLHLLIIIKKICEWLSNSVPQIIISSVLCVRCNDDLLCYKLIKVVSDSIGSKCVTMTPTNEITLNDTISARNEVVTSMENVCYFTIIELINLIVRVCNANLFLVEDCFSPNKKCTCSRIFAPYDSRSLRPSLRTQYQNRRAILRQTYPQSGSCLQDVQCECSSF